MAFEHQPRAERSSQAEQIAVAPPRTALATGPSEGRTVAAVNGAWSELWISLNQLATHFLLLCAITLTVYGGHIVNHWIQEPDGLILFESADNYKIPLDWVLSVGEGVVFIRFFYKSLSLFNH